LHVDSEALPARWRRYEWLRRAGVWAASRLMARMDLSNRAERIDVAAELAAIASYLPTQVTAQDLEPLRRWPKVLAYYRGLLLERHAASSLDAATTRLVWETVARALPAGPDEAHGFHDRPRDPVAAFAFVGTRYAARTTPEMIAALRAAGYDDLGVMDLAIAVSDANAWARVTRWLGLDRLWDVCGAR
jgi:hypothetical protein